MDYSNEGVSQKIGSSYRSCGGSARSRGPRMQHMQPGAGRACPLGDDKGVYWMRRVKRIPAVHAIRLPLACWRRMGGLVAKRGGEQRRHASFTGYYGARIHNRLQAQAAQGRRTLHPATRQRGQRGQRFDRPSSRLLSSDAEHARDRLGRPAVYSAIGLPPIPLREPPSARSRRRAAIARPSPLP